MAQKKRTTKKAKQTKAKSAEKSKFSKQIQAIVMMAVALTVLVLVFIPTKNLGVVALFIQNFIFGLFGFCAYIFPIVLGYIAVMIALEKKQSNKATIIFSLLFGLFLDTAFEIFGHAIDGVNFWQYFVDSYTRAHTSIGGGVLGSLLGYPMLEFLGVPFANIIIIIMIVVSLMITTGTTLQSVGVFAKKTGEKAQQIHNDTKEWIEKRHEQHELERLEREKEAEREPKFNVDVSLDGMPDHPAVLDDLYKEKEKKENKKVKKADIDVSVDEPVDLTVKTPAKPTAKRPATTQTAPKKVQSEKTEYVFPPLELLSETKNANAELVDAELKSNCELLVNVLKSFGVEVRVTGYSRGPSVTRYEIQPAIGVRISKITGLADDIALQLRAANVRISPIPNKSTLGIEVPNTNKATIGMREIIASNEFKNSKSKLHVALGKDVTGQTAFCDISKMPHLLVAGTTGSGKSVCLNTMIMSILYRANPDEVKFVMIDPKAVEFPVYNGIPHLLVPVVTDSRKAAGALGWAVIEMEKRYKLLAENGVRNIAGYNELCKRNKELEPMPHIVIIIDEFADLMMVAGNEVESSVCRIAQKARAAGMHLVIATQRPSADIFTGLIKSNIPSRIALSVSSKVNSQIIIDMLGAEKLHGKGDMLYFPIGAPKPHRIQGCFVSDEEVKKVAEFIVEHSDENEYDQGVLVEIERQAAEDDSKKSSGFGGEDVGDYDARINEAIEVVLDGGMASTSLLQRKLKLGYARAARIMDQLEEKGIIGPHQGAKPREVLISRAEWIQMQTTGVVANVPQAEPQQLSFDDTSSVVDDFDDDFDEIEEVGATSEDEFEEFVAFEEVENEPVSDVEETEEFVFREEELEDEDEEVEQIVEVESESEEVVFIDDDEPEIELEETQEFVEEETEKDEEDEEDDFDFDDDFLNSI